MEQHNARETPAPSIAVVCRPISGDQTIALRHAVLWPDKDISYVLLAEDANGSHYGAFLDGTDDPIAVISLFCEECPDAIDNAAIRVEDSDDEEALADREPRPSIAMRFRKFACHPAYQGRGVGTKLLFHVASVARTEFNADVLWCDAREATRGWYERRGMVAFGDTFFKGPVEYVRMKMSIASAALD